jgi:tetratricopeptide (TPR) repeat protein
MKRTPGDTPKQQAKKSEQHAATSRREKFYAILLLAGLVVSAAGGLYLCRSSAAIHYLSTSTSAVDPRGEWIIYPSPIIFIGNAAVKQTVVFRRSVPMPNLPEKASLRIRACDEFSLRIGGRDVDLLEPRDRNWKEYSDFDIRRYLKPGNNEIAIAVSNSNGPPAVWLTLDAGDVHMASDRLWEVSLNGSNFIPAALALEPPASDRTKAVPKGERAWDSLGACRWILVLYAALSSAIVLVTAWAKKRLAGRLRPSFSWHAVALALVAAMWLCLYGNNLAFRSYLGFDFTKHVEYIEYIREHGSLPAANKGWEMYQPPLFYLISAALLKCCGLSTGDEASVVVLRLFTLSMGLAQIALIFACLRRIFPDKPGAQLTGLLLAAFTSVQLYTFHFVANDTLLSVFGAAAIYIALRMLQQGKYPLYVPVGLGVCLGAALLTKITAVLLVAVVVGTLAAQLVVERRYALRIWLRTVVLPLFACLLVGGWHYARLWAQFGTPFFTNMSPQSPVAHWAYPGYSHAGYFLSFGCSLVAPYFSVFHSFADGVYSTLWGDGTWGGSTAALVRPPWNYGLMAAGYLLALVPTVLVLAGTAVAAVRLVRQPRAEWLLLAGLAAALLVAAVYFYLLHPFYSAVKTSYGLLGMTAFCALGGLGWEALTESRRAVGPLLAVLLGIWAMTAYTSFWVVPSSPTMLLRRADACSNRGTDLLRRGQLDAAIAEFRTAIELFPEHAQAHNNLGVALGRHGNVDDAVSQYQQALAIDPGYTEAHVNLGVALAGRGDVDQAIVHFQKALDLAPQNIELQIGVGDVLAARGRHDDACIYYQKALEMAVATRHEELVNAIRTRVKQLPSVAPRRAN